MDFIQAMKAGRRKVRFLWFRVDSGFLLSLRQLQKHVPATGETTSGNREIPVARIIGSENRSRDFAEGFLPLRRDMEERWNNVRRLFVGGAIHDAIEVIEYGGCYFVRDGNHRVSVAKTNGIDFMNANVRTMKTPVRLPSGMTRKRIPLFIAKARFQKETGVFDHIPEDDFSLSMPENWAFLKKEIFEYHQGWYTRNRNQVPDKETLLSRWNTYIYRTAMEFIRQNYLPFLFPGKEETDIFCDLIRMWNSYPDHDSQWLMEVYNLYLKKALNRNFPLRLFHRLNKTWNAFFVPDAEARESFLALSRFPVFVPEGVLPEGGKEWYRFLSDFMLIEYSRHLRKKLDRLPRLDEVVTECYALLLKPSFEVYSLREPPRPFPRLFIHWMKKHCGRLLLEDRDLDAERTAASFDAYLSGKCL
jgi:hypothetical protein